MKFIDVGIGARRYSIALFCLMVLFGALIAGCGGGNGGGNDNVRFGTVTGQVMGPGQTGTGLPIEPMGNVLITVTSGFVVNTANADARGSFSIPNVPAGNATITFSSPGYKPVALTATVLPDATITLSNYNFNCVAMTPDGVPKAKWSILLYMSGVDMELGLPVDLLKLQSAGSREGINIVAYAYNNQNHTTKLYYMKKDQSVASEVTSPFYDYQRTYTEFADTRTLLPFLEMGYDLYPADHYMVVLWDHGSGIDITYAASVQSVATPQGPSVGAVIATRDHEIRVSQLGRLMADFTRDHPISILASDACLMGMFEYAYEMKDARIDYMVFSEAVEGAGLAYDVSLGETKLAANTTPQDLATNLVHDDIEAIRNAPTGNGTMSAVNLGKLFAPGGTLDLYNALAAQLANLSLPELASVQTNIAQQTQHFGSATGDTEYHYLDLRDFCGRLSNNNIVKAQADALYANLATGPDNFIIAREFYNRPDDTLRYDNSHGIATFICRTDVPDGLHYLASRYPAIYRDVKYYKDGHADWDTFLSKVAP